MVAPIARRVSVVVATSNRAASLRVTLDALRHQTYPDFEVIVVEGPGMDETPELLAERAGQIKQARTSEYNLSKSRNLGIDSAAGEIVAFIDDDSVPEPDWLSGLAAAYDDPNVGGTGGVVYDHTGVNIQYIYAVCDRLGNTDFDRTLPLDQYNRPGADPFLYLQGTNMSFRREALEAIGGFDENIEYLYDDSDIASQLIDSGWRLSALDGAAVHHKTMPSHLRRDHGLVTDPYTPVKNRAYFALRNSQEHHLVGEALRSLMSYQDSLRDVAVSGQKSGRFTADESRAFIQRMEAGFEEGMKQGMSEERAGRPLAAWNPDTFLPYPVVTATDGRMKLCLVSLDYPPAPMGGIARYTADLARGLAAAGHETHVITRADPPLRVDFEEGVWVHRYPEGERLLPALHQHPLHGNLAHCAAVWLAVDRVDKRFGLDLIATNAWLAEGLVCALDDRWPTVVTCSTPIRTISATQPAVAAKPLTDWQIRLEDLALVNAAHLLSVSHANLETVRRFTPAATDVEATVIWHGMADRAGHDVRPASTSESVEILFVGRLEPRKGVDVLLDAAVELLQERPNATLRLVGMENPYAAEDVRTYEERLDDRLANEPELRQRIVFAGEVDDSELDRLLESCDIFCAPSLYESFGLINVEAMMFARPVVSCSTGGIREVVVHGETGLLVEPGDTLALKDALSKLIDDPELRQTMGSAGRARFEREFCNDIAVERTIALYREVLGNRNTVAGHSLETRLSDALRSIDVADPESAVEQLLDRDTFPLDYRAVFSRLVGVSDDEFVESAYQVLLGRPADSDGSAYWVDRISRGSRHAVLVEIARSPEATRRGIGPSVFAAADAVPQLLGAVYSQHDYESAFADLVTVDDREFVESVYQLLLRRAPDPEGLSYNVNRLAHDSRQAMLAEIARSPEADHLGIDADMIDAALAAVPQFLGPVFLQQDYERAFADLLTVDDREFVESVYQLLLRRTPDPDGLDFNIGRLAHESRQTVLAEIARSPEAERLGIDVEEINAAAAVLRPASKPIRARLASVPGIRWALRFVRRILLGSAVEELTAEVRRSVSDMNTQVDAFKAGQDRQLETQRQAMNELLATVERSVTDLASQIDAARADGDRQLGDHGQSLKDLSSEIKASVVDLTAKINTLKRAQGTHGTYLGSNRVLVNTTWGGKLLASTDDLSLTPELVAHGVYETPFTNYLLRTLKHGQTVVDIGANIGLFTVLMASHVGPTGRVIAYEPNPDVLGLLRTNVALNWFNDTVTIRPAAASDTTGRVRLHVTERFQGNSSLLEPGEGYFAQVPMDTTHVVEVDCEPLDALLTEFSEIDLVKIDVEGAEHLVLNGMAELLDTGAVATVALELFQQRMGSAWPELCALLEARRDEGWEFHLIDDDGELVPSRLEDILEVGRFAQVVMTRPGRAPA